jgi:hypothetical protein
VGENEIMITVAEKAIAEMSPLKQRKSPMAAFLLGFFFGALGVAIYFKSWKDFFVCIGLFLAFALIAPWGPGEFVGMLFAAIYGSWRAHSSNQALARE